MSGALAAVAQHPGRPNDAYMQVPSQVEYERATSVDHALTLLSRPDTRVVAGGHSLIPMMKLRLAQPEVLVDINGLTELAFIRRDGDQLRIGALARHADLLDSAVAGEHFPIFHDAERVVADPVVRLWGTVGGSLCQADPSEDLSAAFAAARATAVLRGRRGAAPGRDTGPAGHRVRGRGPDRGGGRAFRRRARRGIPARTRRRRGELRRGRADRRRALSSDRRSARSAGLQTTSGRRAHHPRPAPRRGPGGKQSMKVRVAVTVNGTEYAREVEPRLLLIHFLRDELRLTGSHWGCDTSNCGSCVVWLDAKPVKSCAVLAAMADGRAVRTVEGLETGGQLDPVQQGFIECHGLQCGFCTSGMMMTARWLLDHHPDPSEADIREAISGQICRCTGYENIVRSIRWAAKHAQTRPDDEQGAMP